MIFKLVNARVSVGRRIVSTNFNAVVKCDYVCDAWRMFKDLAIKQFGLSQNARVDIVGDVFAEGETR